jgi:hypothetical protein
MRGGVRRRRSRSRRAGKGQYAVVQRRSGGSRYIFKEAQEIGDSFTLAVGEDRVIDAVLGASCVRQY